MEDPSEDFQLVRDYVDCKNCMELKSFQTHALWADGFTSEMVREAAEKLKINKVLMPTTKSVALIMKPIVKKFFCFYRDRRGESTKSLS